MFGWRRKSDGFEWHEYVRTTIKLRREDRRKKIDEIKVAAAANAAQAGRASVDAGRSAATHLTHWLWRGLKSLARLPGLIGRFVLRLATMTTPLWARMSDWLEQLLPVIARPGVRPMLALVALAAGGSAAAGIATSGVDTAVMISMSIALLLALVALLPFLQWRGGTKSGAAAAGAASRLLPSFGGFSRETGAAVVGVGALAVVGAGLWWMVPGVGAASVGGSWLTLPDLGLEKATRSITKLSPFAGETVSGRASAVSGDTLRLDGKTIKLSGIDAPELSQRCRDARRRRWRCGRSARAALGRLVAGKKVECSISAQDETKNTMTGQCSAAGRDLAQRLVSGGHVFAAGGFYARYGGNEREARDAKRGIWRGNAQKPDDYRNASWEQAKRRAPGGCPIKGRVRRGAKIYVVPWAANYRRVRIRTRRGERWFCSEGEALAAGWRPDSSG